MCITQWRRKNSWGLLETVFLNYVNLFINIFFLGVEKTPPGIYKTIISFCWNCEWKKVFRKLLHLQDHSAASLNSSFPSSFTSYFTNSKSDIILFLCITFSFSFVLPCGMFCSLSICSCATQSIFSLCLLCVLCSSQCRSLDKEHWAGNLLELLFNCSSRANSGCQQ